MRGSRLLGLGHDHMRREVRACCGWCAGMDGRRSPCRRSWEGLADQEDEDEDKEDLMQQALVDGRSFLIARASV